MNEIEPSSTDSQLYSCFWGQLDPRLWERIYWQTHRPLLDHLGEQLVIQLWWPLAERFKYYE